MRHDHRRSVDPREGSGTDQAHEKRERFRELLEELRVVIPGTQVLFAFLLMSPFSARFNELVFYPRLRDAVPDGDDLAEESIHEHVEMKETLNALDGMTADDDGFDQRMDELMGEVRHHVQEEESEIFPKIRAAVSEDDLRQMGERMQRAKKMVPTRPHPKAPTSPGGKMAAGPPGSQLCRRKVRRAGAARCPPRRRKM